MLIAALVGVDMRSTSTVDMEATIKSYPVTFESINDAFYSILSVSIDDGVSMRLIKIEEIRDEAEYNGIQNLWDILAIS